MSFLPILAAFVTGYLPAWWLLPRLGDSNSTAGGSPAKAGAFARIALLAGLAFPLGAGLLGLVYFASRIAGFDNPWVTVAGVALISGSIWILRAREGALTSKTGSSETNSSGPNGESAEEPPETPSFPNNWILAVIATVGLAAVVASIATILGKSPHGAWDSWAIWSVRGKFFAGAGDSWRNALDPGFRLSHPEYPVMLSSFLGWAWRIAGVDNPSVPQAAAYAYMLSLVGLVVGFLSGLRRTSLALLAIPVLLSPVVMVTVPASLYADLPLGVLATASAFVLLWGIQAASSIRALALAGFLATLTVWTKEEGLLHLAVLSVLAFSLCWLARRESSGWWKGPLALLAAAAPLTLLLWLFRVSYASSSGTRFQAGERAAAAGETLLSRAFDFSRYGEISAQIWDLIATLGSLISHPLLLLAVAILILGLRAHPFRSRAFLGGLALVALLWCGYLASFVLMGGRPGPTLSASIHRLWLHTWPLLVSVVFLGLHAPEELAVAASGKPSRSAMPSAKAEKSHAKLDSKTDRRKKGRP